MNAPVSVYQFTPQISETYAELDDVRLLASTNARNGSTVAVGAEGTVLSVWADGAAYEVEFDEGLATVPAEHLTAGG